MDFSRSTDERLLIYYESVRQQVELDNQLGGRHRLIGEGVRPYADALQQELERRRLRFVPIEWPRVRNEN
jgi:hypothetical protein